MPVKCVSQVLTNFNCKAMNYSCFIGIDLSKKTFDVSIISPEREELNYFQLPNTAAGTRRLVKRVHELCIPLSKILFCAEDMGELAIELCLASQSAGFPLALACPLSIKKSAGICRGKSDRIDAYKIACHASLHHRNLRLYSLPEPALTRLKLFITLRENLVKSKKRFSSVDTTLIESGKIADTGEHRQVTKEQLDLLDRQIKHVENCMLECLKESPLLYRNFRLLRSVKGIGLLNACLLICLTGNFTRFENHRKFACYCGVAPFEFSSGTSIRGKNRVSKLGNKQMKVYLTSAAQAAIMHDDQIKKYYKRKLEEGKHKGTVINAIRAKLVARCFAVIRRQQPFIAMLA